jgi:hypothetical protein
VAEQAGSGTVEGTTGDSPDAVILNPSHAEVPHAGHHGRPISWVAVTIVIAGFLVGGIAMVPHPHWVVFWAGAGIAVVGLIIAAAARTFNTDWY